MIWPVLGFGVFAAIIAAGAWRTLRMNEDEFEAFLAESRDRTSLLSAANRAPVAWLGVSVLAVFAAAAVWILDADSPNAAKAVAAILFGAWVLGTGVAISASFWGRPSFLVHPHLRKPQAQRSPDA